MWIENNRKSQKIESPQEQDKQASIQPTLLTLPIYLVQGKLTLLTKKMKKKKSMVACSRVAMIA